MRVPPPASKSVHVDRKEAPMLFTTLATVFVLGFAIIAVIGHVLVFNALVLGRSQTNSQAERGDGSRHESVLRRANTRPSV